MKITLKINNKILQWDFGYEWDFLAQTKHILPWAFRDINYEIVSNDVTPNFLICVFTPPSDPLRTKYTDLCFMLCGEKHDRYKVNDTTYQFCQYPLMTDSDHTRYVPTMCIWCPPVSAEKTKVCSIVDSGKWSSRTEMVKAAQKIIGSVDVYSKLPGWHSPEENKKHTGIDDYAFYLSIENCSRKDYVTEKLLDAFVCEACPIYYGAENVEEYIIKDSYIPINDISNYDWGNWKKEYDRRKFLILQQKEFIRTRLNVFSYFTLISNDLKLLGNERPITIQNGGYYEYDRSTVTI